MALAVWGVRQFAEALLEDVPTWMWRGGCLALGVAGQCLIDYQDWWYGLAWGSAALLLTMVSDLLLVVTDRTMVSNLRTRAREGER